MSDPLDDDEVTPVVLTPSRAPTALPPPPRPSMPPLVPKKPGGSGEHRAVQAFRKKLVSYAEQMRELRALSERARRLSDRVPDPRREGESDPPVDIVSLPEMKR